MLRVRSLTSQLIFGCHSVGFIFGAALTSTFMTLVGSAVNTVIVCFAEAPQEFRVNHPKLSEEMHAAWTKAWPDEYRG